ncbi:MAG: hypothetical protein AAGD38_17170 [Acidobacteriota bacterium]
MTNHAKSWLWWLLALSIAATMTLACAEQGGEGTGEDYADGELVAETASCTEDGTTLQLDCPSMPFTNAQGTITSGILDYDIFAWNSFVALNWPALDPTSNNNQRGFPDLSTSFATAASDDLVVWETFKEKREIFLYDYLDDQPSTETPPAWNAEPQYGPSNAQVPCCPGYTCDTDFGRHAANNTGDETAEVASEARETDDVLCQGHDPDCGVSGQPVGPRVWRGQPSAGMPLIYEVKVNWDFYNYVATFSDPGPLWFEDNAKTAADAGDIRLPIRTSSATNPAAPGTVAGSLGGTAKPGPNPSVINYSPQGCIDNYYSKATSSSDLTPCPMGSVHLKSAWMPLSGSDDMSKYHTSELLFYVENDDVTGGICAQPATYGLVGFHIIQRIHETRYDNGTPFPNSHPRGGTFIFASWEHTQNDDQGFTYANLYPTTSDSPDPYPNVNEDGVDGIPLNRAYDLLSTTVSANDQVHTALGCTGGSDDSVWCNYELIGTQYAAVNGPPPGFDTSNPPNVLPSTPEAGVEYPANSGQPYFLANLVVESNVGLQQFLGLPPGTTPIDHYTSPQIPPGGSGRVGNDGTQSNTGSTFDLNAPNLAFRIAPRDNPAWDNGDKTHQSTISGNNGQKNGNKVGAWNMGGCMGCHGVAQQRGYAFSFVLLGNQGGGKADTQTMVDIPPPPESETN